MAQGTYFELPPGIEHNSETAKRARMEMFSEWLITPPAQREPRTQKELAELLGVSEATLSTYKKEPLLQAMVEARVRETFGATRLADVIENLYQIALQESNTAVQAAKTLLNWYEKANAEIPLEYTHLSDEELASLGKEKVNGEGS